MTSDSLIDSLESALAANPSDRTLRFHLVDQLLGASRPDRALELCVAGLETGPPATVAELALASRAATDADQPYLVEMYRIRLEAITGDAVPHQPTPDQPSPDQTSPDQTSPDQTSPDQPTPAAPWPPVVPTDDGEADRVRSVDEQFAEIVAEVERPDVTMADVAGLADVKEHLDEAVFAPMDQPELREAFGLTVRGGLLLWGPPGCGKTFLAKALAGQFGAGFISIAMSDVLDMWLGNSEQNLHAVFNQARQYADVSGTPCVVFIDELDGLGSRRSRVAHSGIRSVVTQLLTELDGTESDNDGVVVVGATNTPWDVEPALRRPGRFDRTICVLPPDLEARTAILAAAFRSRPVAPDLDLASVARRTDGHSGADLSHVAETALRYALRESRAAGTVVPVQQAHLDQALGQVPASTGEWLSGAAAAARYSSDPTMFEPLVRYLKARKRW